MTEPRRLKAPWTIKETDAAFGIQSANGLTIAFVYFEEESVRRANQNLLTRDEARRVAADIAKLPDSLQKGQG